MAAPTRRRKKGQQLRETAAQQALRAAREAGDNRPPDLPYKWQPRFLAVLRQTANVSWACRCAGISRNRAYQVRHESDLFAAHWDDCLADTYDLLEQKLLERAIHGVVEPVFGSLAGEHAGSGVIGERRKYDNRLGTRILEAKKSDWNRSRGQTEEEDATQDAAAKLRDFVRAAFLTVPATPHHQSTDWGASRQGDAINEQPIPGSEIQRTASTGVPPTKRLCVDCGTMLEPGRLCTNCPTPEHPSSL